MQGGEEQRAGGQGELSQTFGRGWKLEALKIVLGEIRGRRWEAAILWLGWGL